MPPTKRTQKPARKPPKSSDFDDVRLGNDDPEEVRDGVQVVRTVEGRGVIVPRSLTRLRGEALECAAELQKVAATIHDFQEDLEQLVREARGLGVSWAGIGWCVGTTGEAAMMRWRD